MTVSFKSKLEKYGQQGEKTGWTYLLIPAAIASQLQPSNKKSFRVKGVIGVLKVEQLALLPIGEGDFILPVKKEMRKSLGISLGEQVPMKLELDTNAFEINTELLECLEDDPPAKEFYNSLTPSHQRYFSKWIDQAKTEETKIARLTRCVQALAKKWDYGQMIRAGKKQPFE